MSLLAILDRVADVAAFDKVIEPARRAVQAALRPQGLKDLLHGTWLGHPLHPVLVQVPVGSWLSAGLLDLVPPFRPAATFLIGTGRGRGRSRGALRCRGLAEQDVGVRRLGAIHALANTAALGLYAGSLIARGKGRDGLGLVLSYVGARAGDRVRRDRRAHVLRAVVGCLARGRRQRGRSPPTGSTSGRSTTCRRGGRPCARARGAGSPSRWPPSAEVRGWTCSSAPVRTCRDPSTRARSRRCGVRTASSAPCTGRRSTSRAARPGGGRRPIAQEKLEVRMEAGRVMARLPDRHE